MHAADEKDLRSLHDRHPEWISKEGRRHLANLRLLWEAGI